MFGRFKNKIILLFTTLPLVVSGSNLFSVAEVNGEETFSGKTINIAHSDDESKVDYLDGASLIKFLKNYSEQDIANNNYIKAEVDFINKNYRVRYDKLSFEKPFNFGEVSDTYYVEGFEDDNNTYSPKEVKINNNVYPFESVNYQKIATIEDVSSLDGGEVIYNHKLQIDPYTANEVCNAAYYAGLNEINIQKQIDDYQLFLEYETKVAKYNKYLKDLEAYNIKLGNINDYNQAIIEYNEALNDYNYYINTTLKNYNDDLENYIEYSKDLALYNSMSEDISNAQDKYEQEILSVSHHLDLMELFYTRFPSVEEGGTIDSYIHRGAVDSVVDPTNENLLKTLGISAEIIARSRDATNKLRALIEEYSQLRSSNNANAQVSKYNFYIKNYQLIKMNLISLTQCLEKFFHNANVRNKMEELGRTERYKFLLAELIYTSYAFSDTPVKCYDLEYSGSSSNNYYLNPDLKLDDRTVKEILGVQTLIDKTLSSKPLSIYPKTAAEIYGEAPSPSDYSLDGKLDNDNKLIKPEEVECPIEPTPEEFGLTSSDLSQALSQPVLSDYGLSQSDLDGNKIKEVKDPGSLPPDRNEELNDLYDAVKNSQLTKYGAFDAPQYLNVEQFFNIHDYLANEQLIAVMWIKNGETVQDIIVHEIAFFDEGSSPVLVHQIPVEAQGSEYKYFNHWYLDEDIVELENITNTSIRLTAGFETGLLETYNVKWVDKFGSVLLENTGYQYFRPSYIVDLSTNKEEIPTKDSTATTKYVFKDFTYIDLGGESHDVSKLPNCENIKVSDGYLVITVNFIEEELYKVQFVDESGNLYKEFTGLEDGERVNYSSPSKEETESARYVFDHWEVEGVRVDLPLTVHSNLVLKAVFKTINKYVITFIDGVTGHDPLSEEIYEEGMMPVAPSNVEKGHSDNYYYQFTGWDPSISEVSGTQTYVAQFSSTKIISNATIERVNGVLIVTPDNGATELDLSVLNDLIGKNYEVAPMEIRFGAVTLSLTSSQVRALYANDICIISLSYSKNSNDEISIKVTAKNHLHALVNVPFSFAASISGLSSPNTMRAYVGDRRITVNVSNNVISFNLTANQEVSLASYYQVSFDEVAYCTYTLNNNEADIKSVYSFKKGTTVTISTTANEGHKIVKLILANPNDKNDQIKVENSSSISFNINQNVKVYSESQRLKYQVTIFVDNYAIKTYEVEYGKTFVPEIPEKEATKDYYWTFVGWEELDGEFSLVVTGNIDLHAKFESTNLITSGGAAEQTKKILRIVIMVISLILIVGIIFALFFIIFRKKKDDEDENINVKQGDTKNEKKN